MTPVIAEQGAWPYLDRMAATLLRMLALLALVMMPFGMTAAPAAAQSPHHAMTGMEPGHCDDIGDEDGDKAPPASHCALGCSAIAAQPASPSEPLMIVAGKPDLPAMRPYVGRQPEADPPPPKLA